MVAYEGGLRGGGRGAAVAPPLSGVGVSVGGCFAGCFVVWRAFLSCLGVVLLLFSY